MLRKAGAGHWNLVYDTNVQFRQPKVKCLLKLESQAYNSKTKLAEEVKMRHKTKVTSINIEQSLWVKLSSFGHPLEI